MLMLEEFLTWPALMFEMMLYVLTYRDLGALIVLLFIIVPSMYYTFRVQQYIREDEWFNALKALTVNPSALVVHAISILGWNYEITRLLTLKLVFWMAIMLAVARLTGDYPFDGKDSDDPEKPLIDFGPDYPTTWEDRKMGLIGWLISIPLLAVGLSFLYFALALIFLPAIAMVVFIVVMAWQHFSDSVATAITLMAAYYFIKLLLFRVYPFS